MTHQDVFRLAGWLAEHGGEVVAACRGIRASALRSYLKNRQNQFDAWSRVLLSTHHDSAIPTMLGAPDRFQHHVAALQEVATHSALVRVASTVFFAVGKRLDIPLAIDVANRSARTYGQVVQAAVASVTLDHRIPEIETNRLNRLGRLADRFSDLLCGALLPQLHCDQFAVDRERAADFAQTFGRQPSLVRLALRQAMVALPAEPMLFRDAATEVEQALFVCFPTLTAYRAGRYDTRTAKMETPFPRIIRIGPSNGDTGLKQPHERPAVVFPTFSFARSLRKGRKSGKE